MIHKQNYGFLQTNRSFIWLWSLHMRGSNTQKLSKLMKILQTKRLMNFSSYYEKQQNKKIDWIAKFIENICSRMVFVKTFFCCFVPSFVVAGAGIFFFSTIIWLKAQMRNKNGHTKKILIPFWRCITKSLLVFVAFSWKYTRQLVNR